MTHFPIKDLKRADYNPRVMPDSEMQALMKSIETHGFVEPIVVNVSKERYGMIVGGHQRLAAVETLISKGITPKGIGRWVPADGDQTKEYGFKIPCFEVDLTLEAEKQLNLGLNKIRGRFDEDKLYTMILEMKGSSDLPTTGFREDEVSRILDRNMQDPLEAAGTPPRDRRGGDRAAIEAGRGVRPRAASPHMRRLDQAGDVRRAPGE